MSEICGRRRLAKLAYVTGATGNLRGFLEEPKQETYDYRLTDPFAFHAAIWFDTKFLEVGKAFLEVKEKAQSTQSPREAVAADIAATLQESSNPEEDNKGREDFGGVVKQFMDDKDLFPDQWIENAAKQADINSVIADFLAVIVRMEFGLESPTPPARSNVASYFNKLTHCKEGGKKAYIHHIMVVCKETHNSKLFVGRTGEIASSSDRSASKSKLFENFPENSFGLSKKRGIDPLVVAILRDRARLYPGPVETHAGDPRSPRLYSFSGLLEREDMNWKLELKVSDLEIVLENSKNVKSVEDIRRFWKEQKGIHQLHLLQRVVMPKEVRWQDGQSVSNDKVPPVSEESQVKPATFLLESPTPRPSE